MDLLLVLLLCDTMRHAYPNFHWHAKQTILCLVSQVLHKFRQIALGLVVTLWHHQESWTATKLPITYAWDMSC